MPQPTLRVLICGDLDDAEMRPVAEALAGLLSDFEVRRTCGLGNVTGDAARADDIDWTPDLIVVAQVRPEQFSLSEVRRLQRRFPLARCLCCYGVWCESDGRSSSLWPDAVRVSARTATARIRRELAVLDGRCVALPLTASRDEIFEFDSPGDFQVDGKGALVRVVSPDREFQRSIEDLIASAGFALASDASNDAVSAILWDVDPWRTALADQLRAFHRQHPQVALIALMNFGHPQAAAEVLSCGARAVVGKLAPIDELFDALRATREKGKRQEPQMNADERR